MGFPVGYTEVFLPKLFLQALTVLGFVRGFIIGLFRLVGLADFLETDVVWPESSPPPVHPSPPEHPPVSAVLIRELLPVVKFGDHPHGCNGGGGDAAAGESCAVCLYELEGGEEIRWLANCRHIFHRGCLDRWMDHDQTTCPLCRTPFVPEEMRDEFNQRLWAASGGYDLYSEYGSAMGL